MRLAPVVLYFYPDVERMVNHAARSSLTSHGAREAVDCRRLLAFVSAQALSGL